MSLQYDLQLQMPYGTVVEAHTVDTQGKASRVISGYFRRLHTTGRPGFIAVLRNGVEVPIASIHRYRNNQ